MRDPAVYIFLSEGPPKSTEDLSDQFRRRCAGPQKGRETERWWNIAVFLLDGNQGLGRLEATLIDDRAEIAYLFGSEHWGKGYAQEAMQWFQNRLAEDGQALTLWATVLPDNARSVNLLYRLGYTHVKGGWPELRSYEEGDMVFSRAVK